MENKELQTKLIELLGLEWYEALKGEFSKPYMKDLSKFVMEARAKGTVYPPADKVFSAYELTPLSKVRVCIIGQD